MNLEEERVYIKQEVRKEIERHLNVTPVTCGVSCSNCCHVKVSVFKEEVEDILSLGIDIDYKKLESQVSDWDNSDKTCVFIKDGDCSINNNKPLSCISHMVNTPSVNCKIDSKIPPRMVRSKTATERLRNLRKENKTLILHEELYKIL